MQRFRHVLALLVVTALVGLSLSSPSRAHAATFNISCGDTNNLISALGSVTNGDNINLADGCIYLLTVNNNSIGGLGSNGLPAINAFVTINGNHSTLARSTGGAIPQFRLLFVNNGGSLTLNNLTVSGGLVGAGGGGIYNSGTLTLNNATISNNTGGGNGGGVSSAGTLTATNTTFLANSATNGGGLATSGTATVTGSTFSTNSATFGGGIYVNGSVLALNTSTLTGNIGTNSGAGIYVATGSMTVKGTTFVSNISSGGSGGGIFNGSTATLTNSTLIGNSASAGGGIFNSSTLNLVNTTLTNNGATDGGGIFQSATANVKNSLFALNTGSSGPDISGPITSQGYNLVGNTTDGSGFVGTDITNPASAGIDTQLRDNGGPTKTIALLFNSPAINAIPPASCTGTNGVDQRNYLRPAGVNCDIGAYEFASAPAIQPPSAATYDTVGVFRAATFYLRQYNAAGPADVTLTLGASTDLAIVGDWNGDGVDTVGVYRQASGLFLLKDSNAQGSPVIYSAVLGSPGDIPMAGDWDGDGRDGIGVYRPSNGLIYLKNKPTTGFADFQMVLGSPGDKPVAGDWNHDGIDSPGIYRPTNNTYFLSNKVCSCSVFADISFIFGITGDLPLAGDWDGDGTSGVGVFRPSTGQMLLKNVPAAGSADIAFSYGVNGDQPVAGHWIAGPNIARLPDPTVAATAVPTSTPQPAAPTFVP
ncbi:MAG: choice-of-anchor Q domain-containing protein [Chloroflexota bacterium]